MRKTSALSGTLSLALLYLAADAGCSRSHSILCQGGEGVDCPSVEPQCDGLCVAYMDASWDMALVGITDEGAPRLHCPASAPNAGVSGKAQPAASGHPRRVVACSANPTPTCDTPTAVCMPLETNFMACIVRDGTHDCPNAYDNAIPVSDDHGNTITVCCGTEPELT